MASIQVKKVPDDVHRILRTRAASAGQSLQEYLLGRLVSDARRESLDDVLARVGERSSGDVDFEFAAETVRVEREGR